jgi:hypothetical protein
MTTADAALDAGPRMSAGAADYLAAITRYLIRSVPAVTAETLAICRITFGASILFFWSAPGPGILEAIALSGPLHPITKVLDQTGFLTLLSSTPALRLPLFWTIVALLVAFIVGFLTRLLYPVLVVLFWVAAFLSNQGHFITPLLIAMTVTMPAPWSARWSFDAVLSGGGRESGAASPYFGYPIWLLGLTIGLTYTSAGLSKLVMTEGAWLWETGARTGFIQHLGSAVTDWGIVFSNNYWLALGASILSAVGQGIYVWASFTRSPAVKYGIGLFVALPFLIGLVLFMGLFWWPWAVLVLMLYLPWPTIDRLVNRRRAGPIAFGGTPQRNWQRRWFLSATILLIALHTYAVVTRSEYEPLYSNYPMYADRMLANSDHEKQFWGRFKPHGRNYKYAIQVVGQTASGSVRTRDLTLIYDLASFLTQFRLANLRLAELNPRSTLVHAEKALALSAASCADLQALAADHAPADAQASAIRFGRRYFELSDGQLKWLPVEDWLEIETNVAGCPYRGVAGS